MITCDYARKDVDLKMTELRHEFDDVVIENVHRHIGEKYCLEIFIAEGNSNRILGLVGRVRGMRGIQQVKAMFMSL
jgi:CopG family nickel-responsive transcriptional regulator